MRQRGRRVVHVIRNRRVLDSLDNLINDEDRDEKPFARPNRVTEAILDFNVELRGGEDAVQQVFKLHPVDVVERTRAELTRRWASASADIIVMLTMMPSSPAR